MLATFQDVDRLYMALELVNGRELFTLLRERIKFTLPQARTYMAEMICAISHLHSLQICFRDVKPENILIHASGHLKLTDFGFAKYLKDGKTHTVCGTAVYMAPEILRPMKGDATRSAGYGLEADCNGMGILFFEMLTGKPPFTAIEDQDIFQETMRGHIRYPAGLDKSARDCIARLLHRDPDYRLGSAHSKYGKVQLHACFSSIDWEAAEAGRLEPPWKPNVRDKNADTSLFGTFPESTDGVSIFGRTIARSSRSSVNGSAFGSWEERRNFREEAFALASKRMQEIKQELEDKKKTEEAEQLKLQEIFLKETADATKTSETTQAEVEVVNIVRTSRASITSRSSGISERAYPPGTMPEKKKSCCPLQ
jgi:serine/threonine protein kinase